MRELLVTTSLIECLIPDRQILFLGDWCIPYDRVKDYKNISYKFSKPYGPNLDSVKNISDYSKNIYEKILFNLTRELNKVHTENKGVREWEIILGHWLMRYIRVSINRYKTIEQVLNTNRLIETVELIYSDQKHQRPPIDSMEAIVKFRDPQFNYDFFLDVIKRLDTRVIKYIKVNYDIKKNLQESNPPQKNNFKNIYKSLNLLLSNWSSKKDSKFIINPYLGKIEELYLHIKLRQLPKIFRYEQYSAPNNYDLDLRKTLSLRPANFGKGNEDDLSIFIAEKIFDHMPMSFLENYMYLKNNGNLSSFPTNPKYVITANSFDTDDFFKIWLSEKIKKNGTKYIAIQHGGGYGTSEVINPLSIEEKTSDYFITWGWKKSSKYIPIGIFNNQGLTTNKLEHEKKILIVMAVEREKVFIHDVSYEFKKYLLNLIKFYDGLNENIRASSLFRLSPNFKDKDQREDLQLKGYFPDVKIDDGVKNIFNLYAKAKLVIQTVNSTSFLETLALNIPTIGIFDESFIDINEYAKKYFEDFKSVGLIYYNSNEASNFINLNFNTIDAWWFSQKVQQVRISFINEFAKPANRINGLLGLLSGKQKIGK